MTPAGSITLSPQFAFERIAILFPKGMCGCPDRQPESKARPVVDDVSALAYAPEGRDDGLDRLDGDRQQGSRPARTEGSNGEPGGTRGATPSGMNKKTLRLSSVKRE